MPRPSPPAITITPYTNPPLRPGIYYVALAVFTTDKPVSGNITATVTGKQSARVPLAKGAPPLRVVKSQGARKRVVGIRR